MKVSDLLNELDERIALECKRANERTGHGQSISAGAMEALQDFKEWLDGQVTAPDFENVNRG